MKKELEELREGPEENVHMDSLRVTLKKIPNWKMPDNDSIHGFWFKRFMTIYDRLTLQLSKCQQEGSIAKWMTKERTTLI